MRAIITAILLTGCLGMLQAQWIYQGNEKERAVPNGKGQEFDQPFFSVGNIHFVQFGVYPSSIDPFTLGAPNLGQVWIIYHRESFVKGQYGAFYIVKPFPNADEARKAAARYNKAKIDCWYNTELTGATFNLIGTTYDRDAEKAIGIKN